MAARRARDAGGGVPGALVSCADSLAVVDLPIGARQLELGADTSGQVPADLTVLLF